MLQVLDDGEASHWHIPLPSNQEDMSRKGCPLGRSRLPSRTEDFVQAQKASLSAYCMDETSRESFFLDENLIFKSVNVNIYCLLRYGGPGEHLVNIGAVCNGFLDYGSNELFQNKELLKVSCSFINTSCSGCSIDC